MFSGAIDAMPGMPRDAWRGSPSAAGDVPAAPDLRLVPPAVAVWAGAAIASGQPLPTAVLAGSAGVVVGVVAVVAARLVVSRSWRRMRRPAAVSATATTTSAGQGHRASGRAGLGLTVAVALAFLAAGVVAAGLAVRARSTSVVASLAAERPTVEVDLVVTDDPRLARSSLSASAGAATARPMVVIAARTEHVAAGGLAVGERQPILVLATDDSWQSLVPSQRVRASGQLAASRSGDVAAVLFVRKPPRDIGPPSTVQRAAAHVRHGLRDAAEVLPESTRGLLPALVVGDTSRLTDQVRSDFQAAGMVHLTAVSGSNVAIVVGTAMALARRTRLGTRSRAVWAGAALIGFVVLARPSASVLRAGTMGMIGVVAAACGRPRQALPALSAAVIVLVLVEPELARSVGFALSVSATAGILVFAPRWSVAWSARLPALVAEVAAVAVAAQLACTPVLAWTGGQVSLVAVPANMAAVAAVAPATVLGVLAAVSALVSGPVAEVFAWLGGLPCRWLVGVASVAARLPGGTIGWPSGAAGALGVVVVAVVGAAVLPRRRPRRVLAATSLGALLAKVALIPVFVAPWPPPGWLLVACDVGQGDALVLAAGDGAAVLVDGGPDPAPMARCLDDLGIDRLPAVVVSHLHADHVVGLAAVLGRMPVGVVLIGPSREPPDQWRRLEAEATAAGVPIEQVALGECREVGAVRWEVLGPVLVTPATGPNDSSVVMRVEVGGLSMLLTGDVELPAQLQLLGSSGDLGVDVLKVPHHGAADQDPQLLAATGASVAIISVGTGNTYGHPAPSTLALLRDLGMAVARTDLHSDVAVVRGDNGKPTLVARNP